MKGNRRAIRPEGKKEVSDTSFIGDLCRLRTEN